ncbi:tyrosine-type recombinase/integrase [Gryllotalpicola koreensis]|uniref:Tyr recombinase domain-containing protein n=1 Tax=Gryllotalpicola koreensis TaxID=993086 RepID=A0ABP7ZY37_9MICO
MAVDEVGRYRAVASSFPLLHPEEQTFREMLAGWRNQQLVRGLSVRTIEVRASVIERFHSSAGAYPWRWSVAMVDEFFADRRAVHQNRRSTIRSYQNALQSFNNYLCDPAYGWVDRCIDLFGDHPSPVLHHWNTQRHILEAEHGGRVRPFTRSELQALFDRADDEVDAAAHRKTKGWAAAFRDSTLLKVSYLFGLRRNEVRHLQDLDFTRNPHAGEFGRYGHLNVRFGKASAGTDFKQRNVLAVFPWGSGIIQEWEERGRPLLPHSRDLFPSERGTLVSETALNARFRQYRSDIGLGAEVTFHSLRRSYVTHLIEDGLDALFVQQQVGHDYASTTAIYTAVSSDYRTKTLRKALDGTIADALRLGSKE